MSLLSRLKNTDTAKHWRELHSLYRSEGVYCALAYDATATVLRLDARFSGKQSAFREPSGNYSPPIQHPDNLRYLHSDHDPSTNFGHW